MASSHIPECSSNVTHLHLNPLQLLEYDRETAAFRDIVTEEEILFPPR